MKSVNTYRLEQGADRPPVFVKERGVAAKEELYNSAVKIVDFLKNEKGGI